MDRMDNYDMSDGMERLVENSEQNFYSFSLHEANTLRPKSMKYLMEIDCFRCRTAVIDINNSSTARG